MKKAFIIYIIISIHMTAFAQTQSNTIHDVINKIELKIDSYHSNNLYAAESFAYSLLTYIQRINIYGEYSEETLERFKNVLTTDYSRFLTLFKHQNLNSCHGIQTNKYESQCIIHLYREIFKDIERIYGYEYLQALDKCKEEKFKNIVSENTLVNIYNQYRYGLIEETYYDELRLYLYVQDIHSFEELYNNILASELSDIAKAQIALDCSDILYNYQNYNYAEHILNIWKEYNAQQEIQLYDYIERYRTQICRLSFRNKIYLKAFIYSSNVDFVIEDGNIKLHFNDINEFVRQLEIRALVDEYFFLDHKEVLNNKIKYFEFADSLITNDIRARNNAKATPSIANFLYTQLANTYTAKGDYAAAQESIQKANDAVKGEFSLNTSRAYANLLISTHKYEAAKQVLHEILKHLSEYKFNSEDISLTYYQLLKIAEEENDNQALHDYATEYFNITQEYYYKELSQLPYFNRKNYWESSDELYLMSHMAGHFASISEKCASIGYDVALFLKGLLIRFDNIERKNVMNSGDEDLINAYNTFKIRQEKKLNGIGEAAENYTSLYSKHPEFITTDNLPSWKQVQETLKKDECAIEFIETVDSISIFYGAYVLRPTYEKPIFITLCRLNQIENLLKNPTLGGYYNFYKTPETQTDLYNLTWEKIIPYLKGVSKIYFAPDGILTQLNIEILANKDNHTPMNQRYDIARVSSTALLIDKREETSYTTATLIGGIDYDAELKLSNDKNLETTKSEYLGYTRSGNSLWEPLEYAQNEIDNINKLLTKNNISTTIYKDMEGTEDIFKSMSYNSSDIIHIATHGFYYSSDAAKKWEYFSNKTGENEFYISPMRRSGLVLAGGNHAWLGENITENAEDGILTSVEISNLDFSSTKLVVLSACQTGLGEIDFDGVSGIQKAFKLAGCKTLIMSLWKVDDKATSIMMTNLYKGLSSGKPVRESFNYAVNTLRKKYPDDPHKWAAFIMLD